MMKTKPHYKTKIWITVNGKQCFFFWEEFMERKDFYEKYK